jgi:hypothetical protein
MAHEFNSEDKEVKEFSERIGFGVNKVQATGFEAGTTDDGKDYIDTGVVTEDGIEETVRSWFTGGASNISFNTFRQIAVHNAKTEEAKAAAREAVDAVKDTDELAALLNTNVSGGELWLTKYLDPKRTYQNSAGQTRPSINTNIMGYEPKLKPELMPKTNTRVADVQAAIPGSQEVPFNSAGDAPGSTVPKKDAWAK